MEKETNIEKIEKVEKPKIMKVRRAQRGKRPLKKRNKVKVIPLGGLGEVGKNITAIEYKEEIIVIDCGLTFPDADMYGIDLVIPDISYLKKNIEKVKGIFITHGHEDHIGALPYVLRELNVPVYATKLPLNLIKSKLEEHEILNDCTLNQVELKNKIRTKYFTIEFIRTCHSIADSCGLAIRTPEGVIIHTGDFKIDHTPIDGELIDLQKFSEYGEKGVLLLLADSTNVERPGYTVSEQIIAQNLTRLFGRAKGRVLVATFASNISRIQQIIDSSIHYGRKVAFSGRSMEKNTEIARELGYLKVPEGVIISLDEIDNYPPNEITIVTTGSQGEPMAALSRIAASNHRKITLQKGDFIIISASPIPGNRKFISKLINELISKGAEVIYNDIEEVHVSGHACQEELKLMHALIKPKFFMPAHGEFRHLKKHALLAESLGMDPNNIFILENGDVLELDRKSAKKAGKVQSGAIMVDGSGIGDVGYIVLRDRKTLAKDGILTVVVTIDSASDTIASGPDIISRGFIYVKESNELITEATNIAREEVEKCLFNGITEWNTIKSSIRNELSQFLFKKTGRKPVIMPIIMEI